MAKVIGNLCAPTGKYIKDGEEKTSWTKCGIVMETDKGLRVKMDVVPLGGEGWFSVFPLDDRGKSGVGGNAPGHGKSLPSGRNPQGGAEGVGDDDIPF